MNGRRSLGPRPDYAHHHSRGSRSSWVAPGVSLRLRSRGTNERELVATKKLINFFGFISVLSQFYLSLSQFYLSLS